MPPKRKVKDAELVELPDGTLEDVGLMELPDETPEVVPIVCNGIPGHFVVRTKTIVNEHFREDKVTVFTKATGTNNPWKTAVHIAAVGKQAGTVMSKWLNDRGITSPMLTELGRNARDSGWHRPLLPGELANKSGRLNGPKACQGILDVTEESQASGAASFLSSTPSRLTHSDMGPPAHKTMSLQELTAGKGPQPAPRVRFPARPALQNGLSGKDSPAQEQAASCNDAGSHAESDCVTPHNQLKEQRQAWASPAGAEASTPGALLYHDRTPVSPANMILLNRHPAQQSADLLAASPPPTNPSAQQNGPAVATQTGQHAQTANGDVQASVPSQAHQSAQAREPTPTVGAQATKDIGRANEAAALEILQNSCPAQPVPARKPKGKGFLGGQVPDASPKGQHASPSNDQGYSEPCQIAEHHKNPENAAQYHSAPPSCQPSSLGECPNARPAQAKSGQQPGSAQKHQQSPSMNGKSKQPTPSNAADGVSRHSPELENASVHQAVEAVQGIVDAVAPEQDQNVGEALTSTPEVSPRKQADTAVAGAATAAKKQHSTPPIKDVRTSSLHDQATDENAASDGTSNAKAPDTAGRPSQNGGSHAKQGAEALPGSMSTPASQPSIAATPGSITGTPKEGSNTPLSRQPSTKRKPSQRGPSDEAELRQMMAKKFKGLSEAKQARQALEAELASVRQELAAQVTQLEAERDASAAQAQAARQDAASGAEKVSSMQTQLSNMEQKLAAASQTEASAKLEISKVKQEALQAKQSMFNRHSTAEKALREHKELLTTAREELAGQKSLIETLRANAKNLRQQISAIKKEKEDAEESQKRMQAEIQQICTDRDAFQAAKDELRADVKNLETQVQSAKDTAQETLKAAAAEKEAATSKLSSQVAHLQSAVSAAESMVQAAQQGAAKARAFAKTTADQHVSVRAEAASYKKEAMSLVDKVSQLDKSAKEASEEHTKALQAAEAKAAKAEEGRKQAIQGCKRSEESKRKAQEELVGARQAEKATQRRLTALENDIVAAAAQAKEKQAEHARALQAAQTRSKQASKELQELREKHAAQTAALEATHSQALQQQKSTLEQQLMARLQADAAEVRKQIRIEIMREIVEDPEYQSGGDDET